MACSRVKFTFTLLASGYDLIGIMEASRRDVSDKYSDKTAGWTTVDLGLISRYKEGYLQAFFWKKKKWMDISLVQYEDRL
jgi:hypothetical protein